MSDLFGEPKSDERFDAFWKAYPRKDSKGHARKAFVNALRKVSFDKLMQGLRLYPFSHDHHYVPYPATWLNGERWEIVDHMPAGLETGKPNSGSAPIGKTSWMNRYDNL